MNTFRSAAALIAGGIAARAFPAASVEVGRGNGVLWREAFGTLTYDAGSPATTRETVFDLASLTKVIATATLAMRAVDGGRLRLDDRLTQWLPQWRGRADREEVTIEDLLAHCAGLPGYLPFYRDCTGRAEFEAEICRVALEYAPRTRSIYSDLGYILLAFIIEDARAGLPASPRHVLDPATMFAAQFHVLASYLTSEPLLFNPPRELRKRIAPTEVDAWRGRLLIGEVHDENAWALGGAAGHAGLFATAAAVGAFARAALRTIGGEQILATPATFRRFIARTSVPNSSRALGWDTMLPTSSCGTRLSPTAIGHTGFTGTSLWIDHERDLYVVLLTNRVHPTRDNNAHKSIRRSFHDAVVAEIVNCQL